MIYSKANDISWLKEYSTPEGLLRYRCVGVGGGIQFMGVLKDPHFLVYWRFKLEFLRHKNWFKTQFVVPQKLYLEILQTKIQKTK